MPWKNCNEKHYCFQYKELSIEQHCLKQIHWNYCAFQQHKLSNEKHFFNKNCNEIKYLEFQSCPFLSSSCAPAHMPACLPAQLLACKAVRLRACPPVMKYIAFSKKCNDNQCLELQSCPFLSSSDPPTLLSAWPPLCLPLHKCCAWKYPTKTYLF